jgi:RimJ/RimL family protein N-acetyltransferase
MPVPTFETPRLRLRPFREDDASELHRILAQDDMLKYFPRPGAPPLERVQKLVLHQIEQWSTVGYAWWAVELKASRLLVGWNGLQYLPETDETEIGYPIDGHCGDKAHDRAACASDSSRFTEPGCRDHRSPIPTPGRRGA